MFQAAARQAHLSQICNCNASHRSVYARKLVALFGADVFDIVEQTITCC